MTIHKGEWYTYCCTEDLQEATEDFDCITDFELQYRVYPTEKIARAEEQKLESHRPKDITNWSKVYEEVEKFGAD